MKSNVLRSVSEYQRGSPVRMDVERSLRYVHVQEKDSPLTSSKELGLTKN